MEIKRAGSQPSGKGPSEWFTGTVRIDPLFQAPDPALVQGASVTFEPGARTAWHTHPLGQTLIVIAGCGWARRWGGPIEEIRPGDVAESPDERSPSRSGSCGKPASFTSCRSRDQIHSGTKMCFRTARSGSLRKVRRLH